MPPVLLDIRWCESNDRYDAANPSKGRFRDLLMRSLQNFLASRYRATQAQKRRPSGGFVGLDPYIDRVAGTSTPEGVFAAAWVRSVIENALASLETEFTRKGQNAHLACFRARVVEPILDGVDPPSVKDLARLNGLSESQVSNYIVTCKRAFQRHLEEEVLGFASSRKDAAVELQNITQFLAAGALAE